MKITRGQLQRIIREEKAILERSPTTMRTGMTSGGKGPMPDLPPKSRETLQKELRSQMDSLVASGKTDNIPPEWLENYTKDKIHDMDPKFSIYTPEERGGPTVEELMALQKALNPTMFGKFKKMFGFKESAGEQQTMKITKKQLLQLIKEEKASLLKENALANAERALGGFADQSSVDRMQDGLMDVLQEIEMGAVEEEGLEDEEAEEFARNGAILAVAQAFQSTGFTDVYMALVKLLR